MQVLLRMLPAYYKHVRSFENTLVTKFYGLHCVRLTGTSQKKVYKDTKAVQWFLWILQFTDFVDLQVRFVIMGNLFCSEYTIHRRFDLKGSSHGRITDKPEAEIDGTTTLKDLDLNYIFRLQKIWFQEFCRYKLLTFFLTGCLLFIFVHDKRICISLRCSLITFESANESTSELIPGAKLKFI